MIRSLCTSCGADRVTQASAPVNLALEPVGVAGQPVPSRLTLAKTGSRAQFLVEVLSTSPTLP
jgi:hypothetical protein